MANADKVENLYVRWKLKYMGKALTDWVDNKSSDTLKKVKILEKANTAVASVNNTKLNKNFKSKPTFQKIRVQTNRIQPFRIQIDKREKFIQTIKEVNEKLKWVGTNPRTTAFQRLGEVDPKCYKPGTSLVTVSKEEEA